MCFHKIPNDLDETKDVSYACWGKERVSFFYFILSFLLSQFMAEALKLVLTFPFFSNVQGKKRRKNLKYNIHSCHSFSLCSK